MRIPQATLVGSPRSLLFSRPILLRDFDDAVVAPLVNDSERTVSGLEVEVEPNDLPLLLVITEMAGVEARFLRRRVGNLGPYEDEIRRAIDRLFTGF